MTFIDDSEQPVNGVSDTLMSSWGSGCMTAATGGARSQNPHPVDSADWSEWLRGYQAWDEAPKTTIEVPDDLAGVNRGQA